MSYMRFPHYVYSNGDEIVFNSHHIAVDDFDAIAFMRVAYVLKDQPERLDAILRVIEVNSVNLGSYAFREMCGEDPWAKLHSKLQSVADKRNKDG